jgi:hypothetical protein
VLPAIKPGTDMSLGLLKQIHAGILNIGYAEDGLATGPAVILLPGGIAWRLRLRELRALLLERNTRHAGGRSSRLLRSR